MMSLDSALYSVLQRKFIVVLATLIVFGVLATGSVVLESGQADAAVSCSSYYNVVKGDTLGRIAARYNSSAQAIALANGISNVNLIFPGQNFCIPAGSATRLGQSTTVNLSYTPEQQPADSSVASMIDQVFGPYYGPGAQQVAQCESGMNPGAYNPVSINGSHAEGVFQILYPSTWDTTSEAGASPYDAMSNIQAAHEIFVRDGYSWREWACR